MMVALTCLPLDRAYKLNALLRGSTELSSAKDRIREDWGSIMAERHQLQGIFTRTFDSYLKQFGLTFPP